MAKGRSSGSVRKPGKMGVLVRQRAAEAEYAGGSDTLRLPEGVPFFKPKKGKYELIIVPFLMKSKNMEKVPFGHDWYRMKFKKHYRIGPEEVSVICPTTIGKPCPICEHRSALLSAGKDKKDPEVRDITPKTRELYNVIDINDDPDQIKLWETSYYTFGRKLEEEIRANDGDLLAVDFAEPVGGSILGVRFSEETTGSSNYLDASRIDFYERDSDLTDRQLEAAINLSEALIILSYEELRNLYMDLRPSGEDDGDGEDDEDGEDPQPSRSKRSNRGSETRNSHSSSRSSGRDDDADNEPAPRKPRKASVEEDDEEEETPSRRRAQDTRRFERSTKDNSTKSRSRVTEDEEEEDIPFDKGSAQNKDKGSNKKADTSDRKKSSKDMKRRPEPEEGDMECPDGGAFGEDCDQLEACSTCDIWHECRECLEDD